MGRPKGRPKTEKSYKIMEITLDESGDIRTTPALVITMFFTKHGDMWRKIYNTCQKKEKYHHELKFHKISKNPRDGRLRVTNILFDNLIKYNKSFYVRAIIVDRQIVNKEFFKDKNRHPDQAEYDHFVELLVMHYTKNLVEDATLWLDKRYRAGEDTFMPKELQTMLNTRSRTSDAKKVKIVAKDSKEEPLIQIVDVIGGAIYQYYFPSKNPNKIKLAKKLSKLFEKRIYIWRWQPPK